MVWWHLQGGEDGLGGADVPLLDERHVDIGVLGPPDHLHGLVPGPARIGDVDPLAWDRGVVWYAVYVWCGKI